MRKRTRFLWAVSVCLLVILGTEKRLAAAPAGEQGAPQLTGPAQVAIPATSLVARDSSRETSSQRCAR